MNHSMISLREVEILLEKLETLSATGMHLLVARYAIKNGTSRRAIRKTLVDLLRITGEGYENQ